MPTHSRPYNLAAKEDRLVAGAGRQHVVDIALAFGAIEEAAGPSARARAKARAAIQRRYGKTAGYVSVMCRIGRAIGELPAREVDRLRSPRIGVRAVQGIVRRGVSNSAMITALRALLSAPVERRWRISHDAGRRGAGAAAKRDGVLEWRFEWDEIAARQDPAGYTEDLSDRVMMMLDDVAMQLRYRVPIGAGGERVVTLPATSEVSEDARLVGQSLTQLMAEVERRRQAARATMEQVRIERQGREEPNPGGSSLTHE